MVVWTGSWDLNQRKEKKHGVRAEPDVSSSDEETVGITQVMCVLLQALDDFQIVMCVLLIALHDLYILMCYLTVGD